MENKIYDLPKGLKCKYVFLENDFPIFFSCIDDDNNDYLGCFSASEDDNLKFAISQVKAITILKVLMNQVYLYDAFKTNNMNFIITLKSNEIVEAVSLTQLEDKYLPVKCEYLDAEPEEFLEEKISYLNKCSTLLFHKINKVKPITIKSHKSEIDFSSFADVIEYKEFKPKQLGGLNATRSA